MAVSPHSDEGRARGRPSPLRCEASVAQATARRWVWSHSLASVDPSHSAFAIRHSNDGREKVWRALTDPELLGEWLMPTDMQARIGNRFKFKSRPTPWWDGIVNCELREIELHSRLRYTWQGASLDTVVIG